MHFVFASLSQEPTPITLRFDVAEGYPYPNPDEFSGLVTPWTDGVEPLLPSMIVPGEGYYEMVVPASSWPGMFLGFWYGISKQRRFGIQAHPISSAMRSPRPSIGIVPTMRSYTISSWVLFGEWDLPGDVIMWADASCCETPVAIRTIVGAA